ncbi:MAG TPA: MarR family winged helix-turn-helix transcriptional regulator [Actinomycetota bacterium]
MDGNDLSRLLLEAHRVLSFELDGALEERGYPDVRPGHAVVFLTVDRRSGSRLTDLSQRAGVSKQAMMLSIDELEVRGYVRRVPDPSDARAKLVRLTAKGRRCATECRRAVGVLETHTRRALGQRRYDALRSSLELLAGHSDPGDAV